MAGRLDGKVAIVTGAARGQGAAHGRLFAEEGAKVILADVLDGVGEELAASLVAEGLEVEYAHLNVADEARWEAVVARARASFGRLDVLVNNAGIVGSMKSATEEDLAAWQRIIAINQTGVLLGMKHAIPLMKETDGGSIVNTSSIWGVVGTEEYVGYQATKGAVLQLTRSAANTYAADGIRVNSICPGLVMTPMIDDEPAEGIAEVVAMTPLGRGAEPREIAYGVLFLASDEASFVTGAELAIDGGFLAR